MKPLIRGLKSTLELEKCVEVQSLVWSLPLPETVSAQILNTCLKHNALLLGSFDGNIMTGFCFSIPSRWRGASAHHSHMLAVLPDYQDQGTGFILKQAQFNSLKDSVDWITWTFDPLESRNARLNLKLGASIDTYLRDIYGDGESCGLHQGLGTDRFVAEWPTKSQQHPWIKLSGSKPFSGQQVLSSEWDRRGFYRPSSINLARQEASLLLEIPENIQKIKKSDPGCAQDWRTKTRQVLECYFKKGYSIREFHTYMDNSPPIRRSFYILSREYY